MSVYEYCVKCRDDVVEFELIDDQLGRLLDYLDENGLRENTVVVFMSDHGEMSGDHGLYWKGAYFYEALTHVPLIFSCPGYIKEGLVSDALVELVDIAPTLCELLGYEVPYYMQGKSLKKLLCGECRPDYHKDAVYCEFYSCLVGCHDDIFATMYFDGRFKIINYHGKNYGELYDLEKDPDEYDNLWQRKEYQDLKNALIIKNFDQAILNTRDFSMHRIYTY